MREILFRGKRVDNGEWIVSGSIRYILGVIYIGIVFFNEEHQGNFEWIEVISETVGQYTGLTDKNDKKIFEGDIVNIEYDTIVKNAVIEYKGASFYGATHADLWELDNYYAIEVIGNIHDNPELLKGGEG